MHPQHMWTHTHKNMHELKQRRKFWLFHSKNSHTHTHKGREDNRGKKWRKGFLVGMVWTINHLCKTGHDVGGHTEDDGEQIVGCEAGPSYILQNPYPSGQQPDLTCWSCNNLSEQCYQWTKYSHTPSCGGHNTHKSLYWTGSKCPCAPGKCQHKKTRVTEKKLGRLGVGRKYKITQSWPLCHKNPPSDRAGYLPEHLQESP